MANFRWHKFRRFWAAGPPVLLLAGAPVIAAAAPFVVFVISSPDHPAQTIALSPGIGWGLAIGVPIGIVFLGIHWWAEYRRRTYDPTWALKFDSQLNSSEMRKTRSRASSALKNTPNLRSKDLTIPDLEHVLDFFEDVGFYMKGDQLTPEVAHHAFHHWIRGYYTAARAYIEEAQSEEPTAWEHISYLFDTLNEVEGRRSKGKFYKFCNEEALQTFLQDEIDLVTAP